MCQSIQYAHIAIASILTRSSILPHAHTSEPLLQLDPLEELTNALTNGILTEGGGGGGAGGTDSGRSQDAASAAAAASGGAGSARLV